MECITWFAPILPGKLDAWKALVEELNGPRREEHDRSRKRLGIVREVAGHMQTPEGDFVCLSHEAEDLAKTFQMLATSDDPYDQWFREKSRRAARDNGGNDRGTSACQGGHRLPRVRWLNLSNPRPRTWWLSLSNPEAVGTRPYDDGGVACVPR